MDRVGYASTASAACKTKGVLHAKNASRKIARLAKAQGMKYLKLEVLFDQKTLLPDPLARHALALMSVNAAHRTYPQGL